MKKNDFLLCTFDGDTNTPAIEYAPEITSVNNAAKTFECSLTETGQNFTFKYSEDGIPWEGTDENLAQYALLTHDVFTGGNTDPVKESLAIITFSDGKRYLCYITSIDPVLEVVFYFTGTPALTIENDKVTKSTWDTYPEGTDVTSAEGCILDNVLVSDESSHAESDSSETAETSDTTGTLSQASKFLFVDVYSKTEGGNPDWNSLIKNPDFYGAILKATQGIKGWSNDKGWFNRSWPLVKDIGGERYGNTWFRGAYLFLNFWQDGVAQAEHYLKTIEDAGGWSNGDMWPVIDVELGNDGASGKPRNRNNDATAQQIIDCATACANKIKSTTGRSVMLYGRGAMRDKNIMDKMGCEAVWNPSYTASMVKHGLEAWVLDDIVLWQYTGDGGGGLDESKYPRSLPGFGNVDISVYIDGSRKPSISSMVSRLGIKTV